MSVEMKFPKHTGYGQARFHDNRDLRGLKSAKSPNMKGHGSYILGESQVAMACPSSCMILRPITSSIALPS